MANTCTPLRPVYRTFNSPGVTTSPSRARTATTTFAENRTMERLSGSLRFGSLTRATDADDYSFFTKLETNHLQRVPAQVEALGAKESIRSMSEERRERI